MDGPVQNTDRELYREAHPDPPGDYYAPSIHVTSSGGIGINVGGTVYVRPLRAWHATMAELAAARAEVAEAKEASEKFLRWVNLGGAPSGKQCTYSPKDIHEIHGGFSGDGETFICETHLAQKLAAMCQNLQSQLDAARKREERIMIGGNHLASALIGMFGEPPPDYHLAPGAARIECGTQDIYDAWVCWRTIMLIRDERDQAIDATRAGADEVNNAG